jgi:hypothetical protein
VLDFEGVQALANLRHLLFGEFVHLWNTPCPMAGSYPYTRTPKTPSMKDNDRDITGTIKTTDAGAVAAEVVRLYSALFPRANAAPLERSFADAARLYEGANLAYWPCDTEYHDIQHVLDVTLAMVRLMDGYQRNRRGEPPLSAELFVIGALAALFHDFGYLRRRNDQRHRYGAEYTLTHVSRGSAYLRDYVRELGYGERLAQLAGTMLHFTGYERRAEAIRIGTGLPRRMGELLGTADIIAQMSDRCYLEKCRDRLFPEFVAGGITRKKTHNGEVVVFESSDDLLRKTPSFYQNASKRLDNDLGGAYRYAEAHFGAGGNLYMDAVKQNIRFVERATAPPGADATPIELRRVPPSTLN